MASINSLQDMGWPVSARTLAAASSALSVLLSAPASLALLDLAFLGLFDVAMTRLPFSWGLRIRERNQGSTVSTATLDCGLIPGLSWHRFLRWGSMTWLPTSQSRE